MIRAIAYARGSLEQAIPVAGTDRLPYWRRILLPYTMLAKQRVLASLTQREIQTLTQVALHAAPLIVLQNWVPTTEELEAFALAMRTVGSTRGTWVYDLEDPTLLTHRAVQEILPFMTLVTVPTLRLLEQARILIRSQQTRVAYLPSVVSFAWLSLPTLRQGLPAEGAITLALLGPHNWDRFLPGFLARLEEIQTQTGRTFFLVTDQPGVVTQARQSRIGVSIVAPIRASRYPEILSWCHVGICPDEGLEARDPFWPVEYGVACIPTLASEESSYAKQFHFRPAAVLPYRRPQMWADVIAAWLSPESDYQVCAVEARKQSRAFQQIYQVGIYRAVLGQHLPVLSSLF